MPESAHFSPLIQINYAILNKLSCSGILNIYTSKDSCDRAQSVITEVLTGSSRSDTNWESWLSLSAPKTDSVLIPSGLIRYNGSSPLYFNRLTVASSNELLARNKTDILSFQEEEIYIHSYL